MASSKKTILLIEDDDAIADLVSLQAGLSGYTLRRESDGLKGYQAIEKRVPDLVLLDILLPGENGLEVCRRMKAHPDLKDIPIVILSAKGEELDVVLGLDLGADDYVPKPFSPKVLFSRIQAVLRREKGTKRGQKIFRFAEFLLEVDRHLLRKGDKVIPLTFSEFGILRRLVNHQGKILTRNQLLAEINQEDSLVMDRNIDVHIASLRKKLGPAFEWIETVRGVGYRFRQELLDLSG